ncbi:MFS transporter [Micromonospora sp. KC723]|nr:MFS transporter [Micromonospora sp. KC723]
MVGVFAVAMAISGTGVALPDIGADLDASGAPLQWAVTGYNLALASFTLVCGSLADLFGRRRMFLVTTALFTAGGLLSAVSPSILVLDVARAVAGVGAGGVMACGGALLAATFTGAGRTRAFAAMGTTGGAGVVVGPFLAGWLVTTLGWRASFLVFVAVGVLIMLATRFVAESWGVERRQVDRPGVVVFVTALGLLMFGVVQSPQGGPGGPVGIAVGALLLVVFVVIERRRDNPLLDLSLAGNAPFMGWCLGTVSTSIGFVGTLVYLPIYLQGVTGVTAARAGLVMLMLTVPILVVPMFAGWLVNRGWSARLMMTLALGLVAAGNGWLTVLHPGIGMLSLSAPLVTVGVGMGISFGITDAQAMNQVEASRIGMAAGFLNTLRNTGEAVVIAVFGTVLIALIRSRVGSTELANQIAAGDLTGGDREFLAAQYTQSWQVALLAVAVLCAVAAVVVFLLLAPHRSGARRAAEETAQPAPEPV